MCKDHQFFIQPLIEIWVVSNFVLFSIFTHAAVNILFFKFICEDIFQVYNMSGIAGLSCVLYVRFYQTVPNCFPK